MNPQDSAWSSDVLGVPFEQLSLPLGADDEGDVVATLVRYRPDATRSPVRAVLYVHGWSDYFFQTHLAEYWHAQHVAFYALDLRKFGRSLRPGQTPGYTDDLAIYDADLEAAFAAIHNELPSGAAIMLVAHSLGGLITSLWMDRNPGRARGLILNSPWLELQGSSIVRTLSMPAVSQLARIHPKQPMPNLDPGFYARTVLSSLDGHWDVDPIWRPTPAFAVRPGWLHAVMEGHGRVADGLHITAPVLVMASARTVFSPRWNPQMLEADVVLETDAVARRAVELGPVVTVVRIPRGLHDLWLSAPRVRDHVFAEMTRWCIAYGWA